MAQNIDALYAELYPDAQGGGTQPTRSGFDEESPPRAAKPSAKTSHGFDSDEEADANAPTVSKSSAHVTGTVSASALNTVPFPNISHPVYEQLHAFYRCSQAFRCYVCSPSAHLSKGEDEALRLRNLFESNNTPASTGQLAKDPRLHRELLISKGAFHVVAPKRGNGCIDYTQLPVAQQQQAVSEASISAGAVGGCPFLVCRKCDHPVIRAEGVRWYGSQLSQASTMLDEAAEPETDLYLVIRNYYPDWSRIATAQVTKGQLPLQTSSCGSSSPPLATENKTTNKSNIHAFDDDDDEDEVACTANLATSPSPPPAALKDTTDTPAAYALLGDPTASAYCCQCSWLTVINTPVGAAISTSVADIAMYAHVPNDPLAITKFITLVANGEAVDFGRYTSLKVKRRLPLWSCKGHLQ